MQGAANLRKASATATITTEPDISHIEEMIKNSWLKVAPFWPLKNLIAVNPHQGLENRPIEEALTDSAAYFEQPEVPQPMAAVNVETIKWLQAFFDDGQATIPMPDKKSGFYKAWRRLARFDERLHGGNANHINWLSSLPSSAEALIAECLLKLSIPREQHTHFLTLLLTTLSGWAAHIKYRTEWNPDTEAEIAPVTQADYLAVRLVITCLLWPQAKELLEWFEKGRQAAANRVNPLEAITIAENAYQLPLLKRLAAQPVKSTRQADAQLVFCIDVRSEPFRRSLEAQGNYQTLGFAGFFGIPVRIENEVNSESYNSCPVLLEPKHTVKTAPLCSHKSHKSRAGYSRLSTLKRCYQSLKYSFSTPVALVETMGVASGFWMGIRSFAPRLAARLKTLAAQKIHSHNSATPRLEGIALTDQCAYAKSALELMGLTENFAPLVVFCGHGSSTQNNAYATALDCGACGGRNGKTNARILADILNNPITRQYLASQQILIPEATLFIAAEHNTTTDQVTLDTHGIAPANSERLQDLTYDLDYARKINSQWRSSEMGFNGNTHSSAQHTLARSQDWAQVRPEWGLARNAVFIAAPRELTKKINLEGRSFLHSYDWRKDPEGQSLTTILTAPMVVAQWINNQYLFSTLNNIAYGGGSKITKNITGKLGIMQGNASDLMHGLPLQSVYSTDTQAYHDPLRLMTIIYGSRDLVDSIIEKHNQLQQLFGNGWVKLACIEPDDKKAYILERDLSWTNIN